MNEVLMYECSYCEKKRYKKKKSAREHEAKCLFNKDVRACKTCISNSYERGIGRYCNKYRKSLGHYGSKELAVSCLSYRYDGLTKQERESQYKEFWKE